MRSTVTRQPEPEPGESADDFVDRCMSFEGLQDMDPDQRSAVCWDAYRQSVEAPDEGDGGGGDDEEAGYRPRERLHELQRRHARLVDRMSAIVRQEDALPAGETLPSATAAEFRSIERQRDQLNARINRASATLNASARSAVELSRIGIDSQIRVPATANPCARLEPGIRAARFIIAMAHRRWYGAEKAAEFIQHRFGDTAVAKAALNTQVVSEGGALIPQDFLLDLIELLRAQTVVRAAGPMTVGMPLGNLTIPALAGGASASYQGELDDISLTHPQFSDLNLRAHKLTALVPVTNDLLRRAPLNVDMIVRDDLVAAVALKEDVTFLRSDGSDMAPKGFRSWVLPANLIVIAAGGNLDAVVNGIAAMKLTLINGLSRMLRPAWFMAPTVIEFIRTRRDEVGGFYYKDEIDRGTLDGYPIYMSQQIPTNLGTGNGSEIYLIDMADVVLADTMEVQLDTSDQAAYYGTDGHVISTFQRDQTLFRIISAHDLAMRHLNSLAIGLTSDWRFAGLAGVPGRPWAPRPLNTTWAQAPAAWPAVETGADDPPKLWDPGAANTAAFEGELTNRPGGLPPGSIPAPGDGGTDPPPTNGDETRAAPTADPPPSGGRRR